MGQDHRFDAALGESGTAPFIEWASVLARRAGKYASVPQWAILLDMANGDPLRAAEIEEHVSAYWWTRALAWHGFSDKRSDGGEEESQGQAR